MPVLCGSTATPALRSNSAAEDGEDGKDVDRAASGETAGVLTFKPNRFSVEKQACAEDLC